MSFHEGASLIDLMNAEIAKGHKGTPPHYYGQPDAMGTLAYYSGLHMRDCPYPLGTVERGQWLRAWRRLSIAHSQGAVVVSQREEQGAQ